MSIEINLLSAVKVAHLKEPGLHCDGGGLYLSVRKSANGKGVSKSWIFRFASGGRSRDMGLGPAHTISLAMARKLAAEARLAGQRGIDPIDARREARAARAAAIPPRITFADAAAAYINSHRSRWSNSRHAGQWETSIATYANPTIGNLAVSAIDTPKVLKILQPIWASIPVTADRLRNRIEAILDWATVQGYRKGDNPARWKGHLAHLLPKLSRVRKIQHHPALPYTQLPAFMIELRSCPGVAARALEFAILTAARSSEVLGMRWSEVDEGRMVWTVPIERMKARRVHRVILSEEAMSILRDMKPDLGVSPFVFVGADMSGPLNPTAMLHVIRRMNDPDPKWVDPQQGGRQAVPHGLRSTFCDWAAECTDFPREAVETALAHMSEDETEAAYRRGDLFEKRRKLMAAWAGYACSTASPIAR